MTSHRVECPHCGFHRQMAAEQIPAGPSTVTCPQCRRQFRFALSESEPAGSGSDFGFTLAQNGEVQQPSAKPLRYAGFWIRLVAAFIDSVLVGVGSSLFAMALAACAGWLAPEATDRMTKAIEVGTQLSGIVLSLLYYVGLTGTYGQTFGKMALQLKVIRTDGQSVGYGRAALREVLGKFVSTLLLGVGYLMVAVDRRKQALHDKMADTLVIRL